MKSGLQIPSPKFVPHLQAVCRAQSWRTPEASGTQPSATGERGTQSFQGQGWAERGRAERGRHEKQTDGGQISRLLWFPGHRLLVLNVDSRQTEVLLGK